MQFTKPISPTLPRNTSSWKPSFVVRRRSSKDRSRLGGVIHWAKSLNSSGIEYVCVCVCHNVRSIMITNYDKCTICMKHSGFFYWQVDGHHLQDAMPLTTPRPIHHPSTIISKKTSHCKVFLLRRYLGRVCQVLWNHVATMLFFFRDAAKLKKHKSTSKAIVSFSAMRV